MAKGLTLSQQAMVVIAIPIVFQLCILYLLTTKNDEVAQAAQNVAREREKVDWGNKVGTEAYNVVTTLVITLQNDLSFDESFDEDVEKLQKDARRLKRLLSQEPVRVRHLEKDMETIGKLIDLARYARGRMQEEYPPNSEPRKKVHKQIRVYINELEQSLTFVDQEQRDKLAQSSSDETRSRQAVQSLSVWLPVSYVGLLFVFVYGWFIFRISRPLAIISDNSTRLAGQQPLNEPLAGSDELSMLDLAFHEMAETLRKAWRKQRAIKEHARDMIFSLDGKGVFVDVGDASNLLIGYAPEDLVGSRLVNVVFDQDKTYTSQQLSRMSGAASEAEFETRLVSKKGKIIDALLSCRWVDDRLFVVAHDITERKEAQRLRKEVVQMVSHDLRSPLTAIRGVFEMINEGMIGKLNDKGRELLARADSSAHLMLVLVNDLLDIERIESGTLQLNKQDIKLSDVFDRVVQTTATTAQRRGIKFQSVHNDLIVHADPDRLVQVLINLVSNAVKFSPADGKITLAASRLNQAVEITVADEGRGIPPDMLAHIFDRFKQVESSDAKKGTGLGLAICKALVELHGGEIRAESEVGRGSWFSFRLPA